MIGNKKLNDLMESMVVKPAEPVVNQEPVKETTEPVVQEEIQEEVVDPVVQEVTEVTPEPKEEVKEDEQSLDLNSIDDWDEEIKEVSEKTNVDQTEIISSLGKDLGFDDVKTKDEIVTKYKEKLTSLEDKVRELSANGVPENLPDNLKQAINLAKEGGDYLAYLGASSINYDAVSDIDLVANSVASHFSTNEGLDEESLDRYLDSLSDDQVRIEASKLRNFMKSNQKATYDKMVKEASEKKERTLNGIKTAIDNLSEVDGFKIFENQKSSVWKSFYNDTVIKDLFYNERGEFDYNKAAKSVVRAKYGEKMNEFLKSKIRNETKKEIISNMSNIEVSKPSSPSQVIPETKEMSAIDKMVFQLRGGK